MGLTLTSVIMVFCILFALYALGYESGYTYLLNNWGGQGIYSEAGIGMIITGILGAFGVSLITGLSSRAIAGSYSVMFIIPAAVFGFMASFLLAPIGFIFDMEINFFLKSFVLGFLGIFFIMAGLGFTRGVDA